MKGWVGLVGWPVASGWLTHISGHPSAAGQAQDRESSPARDRRSTTVPRHQPPKFLQKPHPSYFFHGAFAPSFVWRRRPCPQRVHNKWKRRNQLSGGGESEPRTCCGGVMSRAFRSGRCAARRRSSIADRSRRRSSDSFSPAKCSRSSRFLRGCQAVKSNQNEFTQT